MVCLLRNDPPLLPWQWSYRRVCENWNPAVTSGQKQHHWMCRQSLWFNKSRSFSLVSNFFLLLWDSGSQNLWPRWNFSQWRQRVSFCVPASSFPESQQCPRNLLFHQITLFCDKGHRRYTDCARINQKKIPTPLISLFWHLETEWS